MLNIAEIDLADDAGARDLLVLLESYARGGGQPLSAEVRENLLARLREVESRVILLARVDGRPAGIAIAFFGFSTFRAAPLLNLHDLAVHPDFRGQGVGRELLRAIEAVARRHGCCRVSLEVRSDNLTAKSLYRSEGFGAAQEFWTKPLA